MQDIISILSEMQSGAVAIEISQKFAELVRSVVDTGRKGDMTIKLSLKSSRTKDGTIEMAIDYDGKVKKPELPMGTSTFFVREDGTLSRSDPRQEALFEMPDRRTQSTGERNG